MSPEEIIAAFVKSGDMSNVTKISNNEYRGIRKGKIITAKIRKYRGEWQIIATDGVRSIPSNTFPWQEATFSGLHWYELD